MKHDFALKKSFLLVWSLFALLFLAACNSDSTLTNNSGDLRGTVTLYVRDANTNLPVDNASVEIIGIGSKKTDDGEASFENMKAGAYFVQLSKKGYEGVQIVVNSQVQGTQTVVAVNVSQTLYLHKFGVSLRGRVMIRNAAGDSVVPADSITVNLWSSPISGGTFTTPRRTKVTSSDGWYSFDSLAELSDYALEVPQILVNGRAYNLETTDLDNNPSTSGSQPLNIPVTILSPSTGGLFTAFARSSKLVKGQPVLIEFSNPVDTSKLVSSPTATILLRMTTTSTVSIGASLSWNSTLTAVSIIPYQSNWIDGATYAVNFSSLRDIYGSSLTTNITGLSVPTVPVTLTAVQNLRLRATTAIRGTSVDTTIVDYATTPYRLSWGRVAGAEGYSVYYRQSTDSAWQLRATTASTASTDTTVSLAPSAATGRGWTRYLMVLPNSSTRLVPFTLGAFLTVTDQVKPSLSVPNTTTSAAGGSFNNATASARIITVTVTTALTSNQNDPIDTTRKPTIRVGNNVAVSAGTFTAGAFVWTSPTTGTVNVTVAAGVNATSDTLVVDFSNVTDLAGNAFDPLPAVPIVRHVGL